MQVTGAGLGGEKSGHVIVLEHATLGRRARDRPRAPRRSSAGAGRPIDELAAAIPLFPQEQRAVPARRKEQWEADPGARRGDRGRARAGSVPGGRVLVRPSGTEPALRVMVEGADPALVRELADALAALAGERLH